MRLGDKDLGRIALLASLKKSWWLLKGYNIGLYRDNGKENGSYYLGFRVQANWQGGCC